MLKINVKAILVIIFILIPWFNAQAEKPSVNISAGVTRMIGDTTYAIGKIPASEDFWGRDPYFPISELKFPIFGYYGSVTLGVESDKWSFNIGAQANITCDDTVMTDSDWGVPWWDPDTSTWNVWIYEGIYTYVLDIYSESESEFDAIILSTDFKYQIYKNSYAPGSQKGWFACYAGFKYIYQHFDFETKLIEQWDLRDGRLDTSGTAVYIPEESNMSYTGNGSTTITYEATYHIPFIIMVLEEKIGKGKGSLTYGISPYVMANDKDTHLSRIPGPIYAEGECTGSAHLFALDLRYDIFKHWFAALNFTLMSIDTDGDQKNHFDAGSYGTLTWDAYNWENYEEMTSHQQNYTLTIGYTF